MGIFDRVKIRREIRKSNKELIAEVEAIEAKELAEKRHNNVVAERKNLVTSVIGKFEECKSAFYDSKEIWENNAIDGRAKNEFIKIQKGTIGIMSAIKTEVESLIEVFRKQASAANDRIKMESTDVEKEMSSLNGLIIGLMKFSKEISEEIEKISGLTFSPKAKEGEGEAPAGPQ